MNVKEEQRCRELVQAQGNRLYFGAIANVEQCYIEKAEQRSQVGTWSNAPGKRETLEGKECDQCKRRTSIDANADMLGGRSIEGFFSFRWMLSPRRNYEPESSVADCDSGSTYPRGVYFGVAR